MGMFPKGTDNTDINKTARSNHTEGERYVAAATDFGAPVSRAPGRARVSFGSFWGFACVGAAAVLLF